MAYRVYSQCPSFTGSLSKTGIITATWTPSGIGGTIACSMPKSPKCPCPPCTNNTINNYTVNFSATVVYCGNLRITVAGTPCGWSSSPYITYDDSSGQHVEVGCSGGGLTCGSDAGSGHFTAYAGGGSPITNFEQCNRTFTIVIGGNDHLCNAINFTITIAPA